MFEQHLKELGYSKKARAGILGNIGVETAYTYDHTTKQRNGNGYGLFQFDFQKNITMIGEIKTN